MHVDELFVVAGARSHVLDDAGPDGGVAILVAVDLVRQGVEETVAYCDEKAKPGLSAYLVYVCHCTVSFVLVW